MKAIYKKAFAEFLGTFSLIFFGCGAIISQNLFPEQISASFIPVVFGLVIAVMIYAQGHISGAHYNPAVTIGFASAGKFPWRETPYYLAAQFLGAIAGSMLLCFLIPDAEIAGLTQVKVGLAQAFVWEFILTFFLMFVIYSVATDSRAEGTMAGIAIGGMVALGAFIGGPFTGASMNPARTFGPALSQNDFTNIWIYMCAPILGALVAAFLYQKISCTPEEISKDASGCC